MDKKLTHKQERFIQEYLLDDNATQAAVLAGYSPKTARSIGQENLTKPVIASKIEEIQQQRLQKLEITGELLLEEVAKIGFKNLSSDVEFTIHDKLSALDKLMRAKGMFVDKKEIKQVSLDITMSNEELKEALAKAQEVIGDDSVI